MSRIHNLNSPSLPAEFRQRRALETATPMNNAAVGRSGFEVYDNGTIDVSNGNLIVNGTATISGVLNADGTVTLSGVVSISGPLTVSGNTSVSGDFTVTGPTTLNGTTDIGGNTSVTGDLDVKGPLDVTGKMTVTGDTKLDGKTDIGGDTAVTGDLDVEGPLDVTGTMDIKGKSTLQNDLTVQDGGKIKVGANMTLTPAKGGGGMEFANGAGISSSGADLNMDARDASLTLGTQAVLAGGSSVMVMAGSSTSINSPLFILDRRFIASGLPAAPAGAKPNLYRDPSSGELKQIL